MASTPRAFIGWEAFAAALAAAGCMGLAALPLSTPAWVRHAFSLGGGDQLHATPPVARFVIDEGGAFVLDRSHRPPLLKFDDSPEVWVLSPSRGPRGDVLYKDDVGDILLRATKLGGMTVFTSRRPQGSAAALVGATSPLRMTNLGAAALYQRMIQASIRCTRQTRHLVGFEAPDADNNSAALIADTAALAAEAVVNVAATPSGRVAANRIGKVVLAKGPRPSVGLQRSALVIYVTPAQGLAGHPSSARIAQAIEQP
ncbi:MAG TPA: DUF4908 domain-containing protein [Caulobacteraceae bacterium]|jgi:hypothetical protein